VPYALVGFGGGARICLGINFAQVEIKAMASHIVRQYTMDVVPGQDLVQFYRPTAMPLNGIKMTFKQR
jgi:retinoid hydroxylase